MQRANFATFAEFWLLVRTRRCAALSGWHRSLQAICMVGPVMVCDGPVTCDAEPRSRTGLAQARVG